MHALAAMAMLVLLAACSAPCPQPLSRPTTIIYGPISKAAHAVATKRPAAVSDKHQMIEDAKKSAANARVILNHLDQAPAKPKPKPKKDEPKCYGC